MFKSDIPPNSNVLPGLFILVIKSTVDCIIRFNSRCVIWVHHDKSKYMMVHSVVTVQLQQSFRHLLSLPSMLKFIFWTADVQQSYLQSALPLNPHIYIYIRNTIPEFVLAPEEFLQLLNLLYELCDSGDLCMQPSIHIVEMNWRCLHQNKACIYILKLAKRYCMV